MNNFCPNNQVKKSKSKKRRRRNKQQQNGKQMKSTLVNLTKDDVVEENKNETSLDVKNKLNEHLENTFLKHSNTNTHPISLLTLILLKVSCKSRLKCKQVCMSWNKLLMTSPVFENDRTLYLDKCYLTENREPVSVFKNSMYKYNRCEIRVTDDFCDDTVPDKFWNMIGPLNVHIIPSNDEVSDLIRLNWVKSIKNLKYVNIIRFNESEVLYGILKTIKESNGNIEMISDVQCLEFNNDSLYEEQLVEMLNNEVLKIIFPNLTNLVFVNSYMNCCRLSYAHIQCPYKLSIHQKYKNSFDLVVSNDNFTDTDDDDYYSENRTAANENAVNGHENILDCLEIMDSSNSVTPVNNSESDYSDILIDDDEINNFNENEIKLTDFINSFNENEISSTDYDMEMKNEKVICYFDHNVHVFIGIKKLIMEFKTNNYCTLCWTNVMHSFKNLKDFLLWLDFGILETDFRIVHFLDAWPHLESINIDTNECKNFLYIKKIELKTYPNIISICINNEFPSDDFIEIIPKIFPNLRILKFDGVMIEQSVDKIIKKLLIGLPKLTHLRFLISKLQLTSPNTSSRHKNHARILLYEVINRIFEESLENIFINYGKRLKVNYFYMKKIFINFSL